MIVGSGRPDGPNGTEVGGNQRKREKNTAAEEDIFINGAGHEGDAVFLRELVILLDVGGFAHDAAGHGPFVDAELEDHQQMEADESDEQTRNDEDVKREKTGKRGAGDDRTAEKKMNGPRTEDGNAAGDGGTNAEAPEGVLIET